MIQSFACKDTADLFQGIKCHPRFRQIRNVAERKLLQLDEARSLADLRIPPQNKLKALSKDRRGKHAIRINDQYRSDSSGPRKDPQTWSSWIATDEASD